MLLVKLLGLALLVGASYFVGRRAGRRNVGALESAKSYFDWLRKKTD